MVLQVTHRGHACGGRVRPKRCVSARRLGACVRTRSKPAVASEGEAKEDPLNACKSYNILTTLLGWKVWIVVGLTQRFRDLVK